MRACAALFRTAPLRAAHAEVNRYMVDSRPRALGALIKHRSDVLHLRSLSAEQTVVGVPGDEY